MPLERMKVELVKTWVSCPESQGVVIVTGLTDAEFAKVMQEAMVELKGSSTPLVSGAVWITLGTPLASSAHFIGNVADLEEDSEA